VSETVREYKETRNEEAESAKEREREREGKGGRENNI